jgi:hypothetical protein
MVPSSVTVKPLMVSPILGSDAMVILLQLIIVLIKPFYTIASGRCILQEGA